MPSVAAHGRSSGPEYVNELQSFVRDSKKTREAKLKTKKKTYVYCDADSKEHAITSNKMNGDLSKRKYDVNGVKRMNRDM